MASLTGQTIASSYEQILALPDGGGNTTTLVALTDGDGVNTFSLQLATTKTMINGSGNKLYFGDEGGEYISSDTTDLTIGSGRNINLTCASGDVVIPANIGLTFGTGEKIEGDSTDLTVTSGGAINLTATSDVVIPADVGITFGSGEKIEGDSTNLTVTSGADINLTATGDVNIPSGVGVTFGDDGEKIEGDGTDLSIVSSGNLNLTSTVAEAAAIYLRENAGAAGTIKIHADQGTSVTEGAESITILSDVGGVGIRSTANLANAVNITVDGGSTSSMTLFNDQGISATEGSASIQLLSDVGGINIKSGLNNANAILLTADGGTSETIKIHADRGTGAASIELVSDAGGITVNAGLDLVFTASGGDVTFNDDAGEIVSFDTSGNITALGDIVLNDGGSLNEAGGTAAFTFDGSGHIIKIGQDTPANGEVLMWDTTVSPARAMWTAQTETGVTATSMASDNLTQGDAAVNLTTSTGDITVDTNAGNINLEVANAQYIYMTDGSTNLFQFYISGTPLMRVLGHFKIDCSGDMYLDADGGDFLFQDDDVSFLKFTNSSGNAQIYNAADDKYIAFMNASLSQTYIKINNDADSGTIPNGVQFPGKAGTSNCVIGGDSGKSLAAGADYNTFIGEEVASAGTITSACDSNVGVGYQVMASITTGKESVAVGHKAGYSLEGGNYNTAIGGSALYSNSSGVNNTAVGYYSLYTLSANTGNTAVGWKSLQNNTASFNTAIGSHSMIFCQGDGSQSNVAVGNTSLQYLASSNTSAPSKQNVAIGVNALLNLGRTGASGVSDNNVGIGYDSGKDVAAGGYNRDANKSVFIGAGSRASATGGQNEIVIGADAVGQGDNTAMIGNANCADVYMGDNGNAWTQTSDGRLKENVKDWNVGLDSINGLRIVEFNFKEDNQHGYDYKKVRQGVIAQEAHEVIPEMISEDDKGWLSANNEPMVWAMVNAIQELSSTVKALEAKVESLESASSSRTNIEL